MSAPLPAGISHLLAADDALSEAHWGTHITLCGQEVHSPNVEHDDVLGCAGMRYCPECVREAIRWSAEDRPADCACGDTADRADYGDRPSGDVPGVPVG